MKIAFIGCGNMATAIINGITKKGKVKKENIFIADTDKEKLDKLASQGFNTSTDNQVAVDNAKYIFLTIKPQHYQMVLQSLHNVCGKIFISVAPAISIAKIENWAGAVAIRTMPNTPALIGHGVTAMCKGDNVGKEDFTNIVNLFESFSDVHQLDESQMDVAIALSGSSPVIAYMLTECMSKFATSYGVDLGKAKCMVAKTLIGAGEMILQSGDTPEILTQRVCSKGGTTEQMVASLRENNFEQIIQKSMAACIDRAVKMNNLF